MAGFGVAEVIFRRAPLLVPRRYGVAADATNTISNRSVIPGRKTTATTKENKKCA